MWAFGEIIDAEWIERGGLEAMAKCDFRIYKQPDFGYVFGFDDDGVDFCAEHWIPLYKARGLQSHDEIEVESGYGIYRVKITETLSMTVEVEADGKREAEQQVNDNWNDDEYLIDSEHFAGVTFKAVEKVANS